MTKSLKVICGAVALLIGILLLAILSVAGLGYRAATAQAAEPGQCVAGSGSLPTTVPSTLNGIFTQAAEANQIEPRLIAVVYLREHGGDFVEPPPPYGNGPPYAFSPAGAQGPMQFVPGTWSVYKYSNPAHQPGDVNDLVDASYAAAHLLRDLGGKIGTPLGDVEHPGTKGTIVNVLASYNAGPAGNFGNSETQAYIRKGATEYNALGSGNLPPIQVSAGSSDACAVQAGPPIEGYPSTSNMTCAAGTDQGTQQTAKGNVLRLCAVNGIVVNASISARIDVLVRAAKAYGLNLTGGGFRTKASQIILRRAHCGPTDFDIFKKPSGLCSPDTAIPGESQHEQGLAVDFVCNGRSISSHASPCYIWLARNAEPLIGFLNLPSEPWHWSVNGH